MTNDKTTLANQPAQADAFMRAVEVRAAQGWKIDGGPVPVLYTDTINDQQVCRDDVWLCKTEHLKEKDEAAPQPEAQPKWQPIETAPKDGRKLFLSYINRNDMPRTVMARWLTDDEAAETDADGVGLEGGWYECIDNWDDYTEVAIHEGEPTHWMPLPAAPSAQAEQEQAKLFTHPQRPLSEAEAASIFKAWREGPLWLHMTRGVEAAHGIGITKDTK